MRNDPANRGFYSYLQGWALTTGGRYQESLEVMKEVGDSFSAIPLVKAINAVNLGNLDEAQKNITTALELDPSWTAEKWRAITFVEDKVLDRQVSD